MSIKARVKFWKAILNSLWRLKGLLWFAYCVYIVVSSWIPSESDIYLSLILILSLIGDENLWHLN